MRKDAVRFFVVIGLLVIGASYADRHYGTTIVSSLTRENVQETFRSITSDMQGAVTFLKEEIQKLSQKANNQ